MKDEERDKGKRMRRLPRGNKRERIEIWRIGEGLRDGRSDKDGRESRGEKGDKQSPEV